MRPTKLRGFTLIELLIVIVIIGILAAIGYPAYTEQTRKTRRADCAGVLMNASNAMERYYTENGNYTGATAGTDYPSKCPVDGAETYYNIDTKVLTATTYTLRATPAGPQTGDKCGKLTLTQTGVRDMDDEDAGLAADDCW